MKRILFRCVALLLMGFIASSISISAMADVVTDYSSMGCLGCHGAPPTLNGGSHPFTVAKMNMDYPTNKQLDNHIVTNMPQGNAGLCVDTNGCAQEMTHYLRSLPPVADASQSSSSRSGLAPFTMQFDGSQSYCDISCSGYVWNFGDGSANVSGVTATHTYTAAGTYTAMLTVTDAQSSQNITIVTITVSAVHNPPVAIATLSPKSGVAPFIVSFNASQSTCSGGCIDYEWDFDDQTSTHGVTATHTFRVVGTHTVNLFVTDAAGLGQASQSGTTATFTVTASSNTPVANATKSPNVKGAAPLNAQFDGSLSNCDNTCGSYTWNFGDGSAAGSGVMASHTYSTPGTYTATLTVTDASNGKKSTSTLQVVVVPAESLTAYVQACQTQLNFQNIPIPDNIDCYSGDLFQKATDPDENASVNDYMGYRKITDQVDMVFACRWLFGDPVNNRSQPISIEMLVHNRQNGNACFFSAKGFLSNPTADPALPRPSSFITSPTNCVSSTNCAAASFWDTPGNVDATVRCINCHISGPYIATPTVAPYLAKDGLLNNGHDTGSNITSTDLTFSFNAAHVKYHAISATVNGVSGAFSQWDSLKPAYMNPVDSSCANGCHVVGTSSPQLSDIGQPQLGLVTILHDPANQLKEINDAGVMPPLYDEDSDYRWINLSIPDAGTESETFANARNASTTLVPQLLSSCVDPNTNKSGVPYLMEAHVVGSENKFLVTQPSRFAFLPDRLSAFNLKDGLVCLNSDQDPGQTCSDYRVHYECTDANNNKTWTSYISHALQSDGDHENRPANICPSGSTATGIEAAFTAVNGWTYSSIGPNDRLAAFSQYGLTCNNADQPDGKCSNYVVRFSSCGTAPTNSAPKSLTSVYTGKVLTATGTANNSLTKGQPLTSGWNTQQWVIEPVPNTEYVRLRNGNNTYLNVTTQAESATVVTYVLNTGYTSEEWIIEPVAGATDVRLKNLWSGKYLTIADTTTYSAIYSQTRNTSWTSQRWTIQ